MIKDVEQLAEKFADILYMKKIWVVPVDELLPIAEYAIKEREISCLEARMEEDMVYGGSKRHERIAELSKKIADLKGQK